MLFNSLHFTLFFPVAVAVFFATRHERRWIWLLLSSYYFYMCWRPEFVLLILCSTVVDYWAALAMDATEDPKRRKRLLGISLVVNLGLLGTFKYLSFLSTTLEQSLQTFNVFADIPTFQLLLPVGISFYTFQTLSYTIEVYRGNVRAERHFGYLAAYVAFWPQLVAGPIERPDRLLPQLHRPQTLSLERVKSGLSIMLWGFFQKLVIADRLAPYVDTVYGSDEEIGGAVAWLATYAFAFQIYCDFSGYSLIAIGAARIMGIDLMTNFNRPYFARSIRDFWQRWHMSLSSWFKDYVYIPLGGNRRGRAGLLRNLMLTFAVSGLWHGAGWTFVVWGLLHGLLMIVGVWLSAGVRKLEQRARDRLSRGLVHGLRVLATFHLVVLAWVFFRATDLPQALELTTRMLAQPFAGPPLTEIFGLMTADHWVAIVAVAWLLVQEICQREHSPGQWLASLSGPQRAAWHLAVSAAILWFGVFTAQEFIYFQF